MKTLGMEMRCKLPASVKKEGKYFISCCPVLDVYSQGTTEKEALHNLAESLSLFFVSCFKRGTLDKVLKDSGFKATSKLPKKKPTFDHFKSIDFPIPFLVNRHTAQECRI